MKNTTSASSRKNSTQTIIRVKHKRNYTVVSNHHLEDSGLGWKATSILTYLLSRPDDWQTNPRHLAKVKRDGIKAVYSGLKELKEAGYVEHRMIRNEQGRIIRGEYIVYEEQIAKPKSPDGSGSDSQTPFWNTATFDDGNRPLPNTESLQNTDNNQNQQKPICDNRIKNLQDKEKLTKSLSFSSCDDKETNGALSIDLETSVQSLMNEISPPHRSAGIQNLISNALKAGHSEGYIKNAIAYTSKNSRESFGGYLKNCIDQHWHKEVEEQQRKKAQSLQVQAEHQKQRLKEEQSKADAVKREKAEHKRKLALIDGLKDITALDHYILSHENINNYLKGLYRKGSAQILLRKQYVDEFLSIDFLH